MAKTVPVAGSLLGKYHCRISLGKYKRPNPLQSGDIDVLKEILLPLPQELRDDTSVSYNNQNLDTVGDILNGSVSAEAIALRKAGDLATGAASVVGGFASNMVGRSFPKISAGMNKLGQIAKDLLPANQITSAVQQFAGVAPNPNPSVEFQGPNLREVQLSWALYPQSKEESENIAKMIRILKAAALPQVSVKNSLAVLQYPMLCQVNMFPWDAEGGGVWGWSENSIFRLKRSFMSSVNVNYHAFGTPSFFQGTHLPTTYQISITFKEAEYMLSDDWEQGVQQYGDKGALESLVAEGVGFAGTATSALSVWFNGEASGTQTPDPAPAGAAAGATPIPGVIAVGTDATNLFKR